MQAAGAGGGAGGPGDGREGQGRRRGLGRVPGPGHVPGPAADASSTTGGSDTRVHILALCVPFPSETEAEVACASLAPDHTTHGTTVEQELSVFGSILLVHCRAENPNLLRASIVNFLNHLSMVMESLELIRSHTAR
uniref:L antigen family member 3 n=1 Tax=Suricata suricatta TaxID=37032 RepID=A0A673UKL7_SURSU